MHRSITFHGALTIVIMLASAIQAELPSRRSADYRKAAVRVIAITDAILDSHVAPPTRQQMILTAVGNSYRSSGQLVPRAVVREISSLTNREQLTDLLVKVHQDFGTVADTEAILVNGVLDSPPGMNLLIPGEVSRVQEQASANRYVGIGIVLGARSRWPVIEKVLDDGPASNAGITTQNLILTIDGEPTDSKSLQRVIAQLRGEAGSEVTLTIKHIHSGESQTVTVVRDRVFIPTLLL